ncbi:MAG: sortase, SrtB family [Bacillales bacterium]|nr:sortase, SrtB family [Bacillales bacterium]
MLISVIVLIYSGRYLFIEIWVNSIENKMNYDNLSDMYGKEASEEMISVVRSEDDAILPSFYMVYGQNNDLRGWLTVPETNIDYPVVQTTNNKVYLNTDFFGNENKNGCLFFDKSNLISKFNSSQCLVIYGHNMKTGQMFHDLIKYQDVEFYKKSPTLTMNTVYEEREYKIFACFSAGAEDENFYNYRKFNFDNPDKFLNFIEEIEEKSYFTTGVDVIQSDSILLLSTCSNEFKGARLVLAARLVRSNEEKKVDTSSALQNKPIN